TRNTDASGLTKATNQWSKSVRSSPRASVPVSDSGDGGASHEVLSSQPSQGPESRFQHRRDHRNSEKSWRLFSNARGRERLGQNGAKVPHNCGKDAGANAADGLEQLVHGLRQYR